MVCVRWCLIRNVWVPGRFPQQGMRFVAQVTVPASQIHNGDFETEVKVPAGCCGNAEYLSQVHCGHHGCWR